MIVFVIIPVSIFLNINGVFAVDWKGPLKVKQSAYGTVRRYCEYFMTSEGVAATLKILPGSTFDTLDCYHCECTTEGLNCQGVGVNGWSLSGPPECTVVADGCSPLFVLRTNNKIDCFTRRPVGKLPNGERDYTVLGHRGSRLPPTANHRKLPVSKITSTDSTSQSPPIVSARSASYRADADMFRSAVMMSGDKSSSQYRKPSSSFVASRLTRKWPVNRSSAYRQTQISSYPLEFKTGDRKMSKSETMVTRHSDGISELSNPIAAMSSGKSANYVVDKSLGLTPARQSLLSRSSPLIMARDTLIPNSDFRRSWKKMVL